MRDRDRVNRQQLGRPEAGQDAGAAVEQQAPAAARVNEVAGVGPTRVGVGRRGPHDGQPHPRILADMSRPIRVVIAKPGLDGHDRGAKVIARALRDAGFEVIYTGLHQTPDQIVETAIQEDADAIGISILSGAHMTLVPRILDLLGENGADDVLVVVGGTIPKDDAAALEALGVARVFTPGAPLTGIVDFLRERDPRLRDLDDQPAHAGRVASPGLEASLSPCLTIAGNACAPWLEITGNDGARAQPEGGAPDSCSRPRSPWRGSRRACPSPSWCLRPRTHPPDREPSASSCPTWTSPYRPGS